MNLSEIFTPEVIDMIVTGAAGGFTAYHGIKIGLFVLGKFMERRKKKQEEKVEEENRQERRKLGRLLQVVTGVLGAVNNPSPPEPEPEEYDEDEEIEIEVEADGEVSLEEIVAKVLESIQRTK